MLLAVVAVGTNLSFPIWVRLAERDGASLPFGLHGARWIDRWVTIPAYLLTALTGIALVAVEGIDPSALWIAGSAVLFVVLMALGFVLYRPVSRARMAAAGRGPGDPEYRRAAGRATVLDVAILGAALSILVLMVVRPT